MLLLAVAVSSLAALMYSVTRHPRTRTEAECVGAAANLPKCMAKAKTEASAKLVREGCATRTGSAARACNDSVMTAQSAEAAVVRPRTDSQAMEMLAKKQKESRPLERPDRGFIR